MKKILTAAAILACTASFAQNINPTVEVTNTYQGNASEVHKPQTNMAVPDSLLRFDMDFGYEVFEKPYQGAYNFKPYMLAMKPEKDAFRGKSLYLKAGAGYSLHPQLDFVYSPQQAGPFQMSVYATNRSYFGKYNYLEATVEDGISRIDKVPSKSFGGYDALTGVGFEGRYNLNESILTFGLGYEGIMAKDTIFSRSLNAADLNVRLRSNRSDEKYLFYDVAIAGRFASDHRKPVDNTGTSSVVRGWDNLGESIFSLNGNIGPVLDPSRSIIVGFEAENASYSNLMKGNAGRIALIPKYRMNDGKWDLSLGVRIEKLFGSMDEASGWSDPMQDGLYKGSLVFPDVHVTYKASEKVSLFASATGGNYTNTYSSIVSRHHFINPVYSNDTYFVDNSTEKVNAKIGVKGRAGSKFQFELDGGAAVHDHGLVDCGLPMINSGVLGNAATRLGWSFLPAVAYSDYSIIYADALFDVRSGGFRLDGGLHLKRMAMKDDLDLGILLPLFSCDVKAVYDFNPRLYAGVRAVSATSRKGLCDPYLAPSVNLAYNSVIIPGYFDLGLLAGYQFNRKLGFWLESGNLLCENIQRSPFYAEKDLWITAGITLNL